MLTLQFVCLSIVLLSARADASRNRLARQIQDNTCPLPDAVDPCEYGVCENGGECTAERNSIDCYKCNCRVGFTGQFCESEVTITPSGCNPICQNGGTCNGNMCSCPLGFSGASCERQDPCAPVNPCQNSGLCLSDTNGYRCDCRNTGFTGSTCNEREIIDPCVSNPCQNGGQCSADNNGGVNCLCFNGFSGTRCQIAPVPCSSGPCKNGGTCDSVGNSYNCICTADYTGRQCETSALSVHPCVTSPTVVCQNGATCTRNGADYACRCAPGWNGKNCEIRQANSVCDPSPCGSNGQCILATLPSETLAVCVCRDRWTGKYCDVNMDAICTTGYCENGGTCQSNGISRACVCTPSHTGERCEQLINGGGTSTGMTTTTTMTTSTMTMTTSTLTMTTSTLTMTTTTSFVPTNNCAARPCLNGGSCFNNANSFVCFCPPQYTGNMCQTQIGTSTTTTSTISPSGDACSPNPCFNSGKCYRNGNSYVCVCASGYTGQRCDVAKSTINPSSTTPDSRVKCASMPCMNGATCYNTANNYFCFCAQRFTGQNCEQAL